MHSVIILISDNYKCTCILENAIVQPSGKINITSAAGVLNIGSNGET